MLLSALIQEFIADGKYRKLSENTTKMYSQVLKAFEIYCKSENIKEVKQVLSTTLKNYALVLQENGIESGGVALRFRVIRAMFSFAEREEIDTTCPFKRFKLPKIEKKVMKYVTFEEYESLLISARGGMNPLRDTAIIMILFDTGIRVGELLNLTENDLIPSQGMMKVRGKTGGRVVPVSRNVMKRIREYIQRERPSSPITPLFLTSSEESMGYSSVKLMLQRNFKRAGLKYKSPHCFRRGFASSFVRKSGGDVFALQRILGHTTLTMSNRYVTLNSEDLKQVHLVAAPTRR